MNEPYSSDFSVLQRAEHFSGVSFFQFLKSIASGGVSAVVNIAVVFVATEYFSVHYAISILIAFVVANIVNFLLQRAVFAHTYSWSSRSAWLFALQSLLNVAANEIAAYVLVQWFHVWYLLAQGLIIAVLGVVNFFIYRNIVFVRETPHNQTV